MLAAVSVEQFQRNLAAARRSSPTEPRSRPERTYPLDILVVDDEQSSRDGLVLALRASGYRCRTAADGFEALEAIEEQRPDVVISDWKMPGMNGDELCRRTRRGADDAPYTYFILLTAFGDRNHRVAGIVAGADDFQQKPVDLEELEARLLSAARVVDLHRRVVARTAELRHDGTRVYNSARTDSLTGAGNRLSLDEELNTMFFRAQRYGHRCSLAICDLDFFGAYSEHHGQTAGDEALRRVAEGMRASLGSADTLFRYSGEQLAVLLVERSRDEAEAAMDRMRSEVEALGIPSPATGAVLTLSVGIAAVDADRDETSAGWIARADAALGEARTEGRNRVVSTACSRV